jgi:23S rRNA (uracil1939-C5)-methyltransferase
MKLRIEKAVYGGAGLARVPLDATAENGSADSLAGKTTFTPYVLPGEVVEAHVVEDRKSFSNAELDAVLEPSPARVPPGCEYFFTCGGCQYQHADPEYQTRMKLSILKDSLERAHLGPELEAAHLSSISGPAWGYRNRIRLHVARNAGRLALCYRERGSHKNLPVMHCPIAAPLLERAMSAVLRVGEQSDVAGLCEEIEFFTNAAEDALLVSLWTGRPTRRSHHELEDRLEELGESLKAHLPQLRGIGLFASTDRGERLLAKYGEESLAYVVSGREYRVSLGSFFQINRFLLPQLLELVVGELSGQKAWDLYAGVGLFACGLDFEQVIAVEAAPFSASDLKRNLTGTGRRAVQSSTLDFLRTRTHGASTERPDLILLDPPRAGLGKEVCVHLGRISSPKMIYVSCDPATLARDLQSLLPSGYRLEKLSLVDLFPQTFHLETVAALARN